MKNILLLSLFFMGQAHASILSKIVEFPYAPLSRVECDLGDNHIVKSSYKISQGNYLHCSEVKIFDGVLQRVKTIVPDAPVISLYINKSYPNASFDLGHIIRIPLTLTFSGKWGAVYSGNYNTTDTVLAHEYGHAIFSNRMKAFDFYSDFQADSYKSSSYELAIQQAYEKGNPGNIVKFYTKQLDALTQKRLNNSYYKKIRKIVGPYTELFADVVAAFVQDRKNAMVNALYYDEMSDSSFEMIQSRDFGENSLDMKGIYLHEVHGMLAPTRRFIGNNLWPSSQEDKIRIINLIFEVMAQEAKELMKFDIDQLDPFLLNASLIEQLEAKLAD